MNGLAFMQTIKSNPKWDDIPVVMVSNSASPEKVHNMLALGVKKYILKAEYRLDEIIAMILQLISDASGVSPANNAPASDAPANNGQDDASAGEPPDNK
jgi:DNA-binding NarL/FixJ family response regulator